MPEPLFKSFLMAGFECASHKPPHGRRLDLTAATAHDRFVLADYVRSREAGMTTVRDGIRWHLIERSPYQYDFGSVLPMVQAARAAGVQVIWDLCHFGWPDDLDVFAPAFIDRFAGLSGAFARLLREEGRDPIYVVPINEPSYLSWAAGEVGHIFPYAVGRGNELKAQLLRAFVAGAAAVRQVDPKARIVVTDPLIQVLAHPDRPDRSEAARLLHDGQYDFRDQLAEAGGGERPILDVIGACYYQFNQWYDCGAAGSSIALAPEDASRRPLALLLEDVHVRYGRPLFVAETSAERQDRAKMARHVLDEVISARRAGIPVNGVCWYPAIDHVGWDDDRPCFHGIWSQADSTGRRHTCRPLWDVWQEYGPTTTDVEPQHVSTKLESKSRTLRVTSDLSL
ncbi:hypothetical protein [Paracoccus benzoatiresistens]|uniref:Beta-glucosidase n=1 Tax=Paracoccus benzoatiresistens TaxID=2997341 RepID=A0ABT4J928_9RHOB|nr:hypothetical protein [Paracoccus sp. EF6]MCZ0962951.1 hypothetical protein [Paracoccus sp. EF6]